MTTNRKLIITLLSLCLQFIGFQHLAVGEEDVVEITSFIPQQDNDYWSYVGEIRTDSQKNRANIRREVSSSAIIDDKRAQRVNQEIIASTAEEDTEASTTLESISFSTTHNGWRVFAEEQDNSMLYYDRAALVLPAKIKIGDSKKYKSRLNPDYGKYGIVSYHTALIGFEDISIPNGTIKALRINQEKKTKIADDEKLSNILEQRTEYSSYWLAEGVGIIKQQSTITSIGSEKSSTTDLDVKLAATNYLPNYLWPEAQTTTDGWKHVEWLGYLTDEYFPWIFHADHGWLFVDAESSDEIHLWSESLGWWLTSKELYPTFYSLDLNEWLTFNTESTVEREFTRSDGTILTASTYGFRFRPDSSLPPSDTIKSPYEKSGDNEFVDSRGNRYVDSEDGIVADQGESPAIELISPFDGTLIKEGEKFLILADAYDQDGNIKQVKIVVNGRTVEVIEKPPYASIFTPDSETELYNVYAIATDNHGNVTQSETVVVQVDLADQIPPKIRVASPLNKTCYKYGDLIRVELAASDEDGFVESVAFLVDGIQVDDEKKSPPYRFSFYPPVNGSYTIGALAIDDDGNETKAAEITITVNETGIPDSANNYSPEVRISKPLNRSEFNVGDTVEIVATASDEDGTVERVRIYVDGIQTGSDLYNPPYRVYYTPPVAGTYKITAKARDDQKNESTSTAISVNVE